MERQKLSKQVLYNLMANNQKMVFHWGHGIILTFILFGIFMAYFYINMTRQTLDLVGENYYEDGQKFQSRKNQRDQLIPMNQQIYYQNEGDSLLNIQLPARTQAAKVTFYRPANAKMDREITWSGALKWGIPTKHIAKGPWKLIIQWTVKGHQYLREERIVYK